MCKYFSRSAYLVFLTLFVLGAATGVSFGQSRVSLREAVDEFNRAAKEDPIGKTQPALTIEEVLAAIRIARVDLARRTLPDVAKNEYLEIETESSIEELDRIQFMTGWGPFKN